VEHHSSLSVENRPIERENPAPNTSFHRSNVIANRVSIASLIVAIASMALTGVVGIIFSPNASQFDTLLKKQDRLLTKDSILIDVQAELFNINAENANQIKFDRLTEKCNRYNELIYSFSEMEQYLAIFRLQKQGKAIIKMPSVHYRLSQLNSIIEIMKTMKDVDELVPQHNLAYHYSNCLTNLMQYKMLYTSNKAIGGTVDTSLVGQRAFDTLMYSIIDLEDKTMPYISSALDKTNKNRMQIDSVMGVNNRARDSAELARNRKHS
jgi:hypothetical protein